MIDFTKLNLPSDPNLKLNGSFEAPIPGESWTVQQGKFPYERPPQFADVEQALMFMFGRLTKLPIAMHLLAFLEAGVPVEMLVNLLVMNGAQEGLWSIPMVPLVTPPITVIIMRMAQAAKITPVISMSDLRPEKLDGLMVSLAEARVSSGQGEDAAKAASKSAKDLADVGGKVKMFSTDGFV